jgi:hypothetical protein
MLAVIFSVSASFLVKRCESCASSLAMASAMSLSGMVREVKCSRKFSLQSNVLDLFIHHEWMNHTLAIGLPKAFNDGCHWYPFVKKLCHISCLFLH